MSTFRTVRLGVILAALSLICGMHFPVIAQSLVAQSISSKVDFMPWLGRDLWFTACQNYDGGSAEKVEVLYVTSEKK